ncbi:MAG: PAS domain S-box protein, partial [Georgfuchsia sp.]
LILSAFDILTQSGDFTWAGYCGNNLVTNLLASGEPLAEIQQEAEHRLQSAQKASFGLVIDMITGQLGLIRALRGLTLTPGSFSTADFNEAQFREHLESNPRLSFGNCSYWIRKQQACFNAGEYESSIEAATKAERYLFTFPSFFEIAEYHFYCGLAHAACCSPTASEKRMQHLDALAIHHKKIEAWAKSSPDNFSDRACLLAAEMARIEARELEAQNYYEAAIRAAHDNGFVQNEALGYELASRFYRARGFIKFADTYLTEARACYARWGAQGKVKQLERLNPWLAESRSPDRLAIASFTEQLDVMAVAKAQRAISGEIVRERLTETLLRIVLESAGAQRGYLLVEPDTELLAEVGADGEVKAHRVSAGSSPTASAAILNYVRRTHETVILADAGSNAGNFASDEYLLQTKPRSVLCMPILRQATLIGVLYLENNLATGAFTPDRRTVLEMLASQAAISLENALVYEALQESESKYRRIIDTANEGIWMLGPDTMTISVNARMAEMLGLKAEEIIGRPVTDFLFEEDVPDHLKRMQSRHRGLPENYERRLRRHNGTTLWTLVSATPIFDDQRHIQGFFAMFTDITERMFAEKALANREREFRTLTENFPDGIVRLDAQGRHLYINPSALQTSGTSKMSLLGKTVCELPIPGNPEVMRPLLDAPLKVVASGKPDIMEFTWPNGRTSEIRHIPELSESGEIISVL